MMTTRMMMMMMMMMMMLMTRKMMATTMILVIVMIVVMLVMTKYGASLTHQGRKFDVWLSLAFVYDMAIEIVSDFTRTLCLERYIPSQARYPLGLALLGIAQRDVWFYCQRSFGEE
eukprot:4890857-Amphidinium_carterae.2